MRRIGLFIIVIIIAFCGYYYALQSGLKRTLSQAPVTLAQDGITFNLKDIEYGGFPLNVRADLTAPQAASSTGSIRAETLTLSASIFNPSQWSVQTKGDLRVDMKTQGDKRYLFDISPSLIRGVFNASLSGDITSARLTGFKMMATPVIGQAPPIRAIDEFELSILPSKNGMQYALTAKDVFLDRESAGQWQRVFGPQIHIVTFSGDAAALSALSDEAILAWKNSGEFTISDSEFIWGETVFKSLLALNLSGPNTSGKAVIKLREPEKLIKTLVETGMMDSGAAMMAQFMLIAAPRDTEGLVELPLPIENGSVTFLGQRLYP